MGGCCRRLAGLADGEVSELLSDQAVKAVKAEEPAGSALEHVRALLGTPRGRPPSFLMRVAASHPAPAASLMRSRASETEVVSEPVVAAATAEAPGTAASFTDRLKAPGGGGVHRVLLLTDGLATQGITDAAELARHAGELRARGIGTTTFVPFRHGRRRRRPLSGNHVYLDIMGR